MAGGKEENEFGEVVVVVVCWLPNAPATCLCVSGTGLRAILRAATLRQKLQIKHAAKPSHSILTPGQPVPALTLEWQAPGRVATGIPLKLLVGLDPETSPWLKRELNPGLPLSSRTP